MPKEITAKAIQHFHHQLDHHPVYQAINSLADLRVFMQHHIYSVWDFMSLIKHLQSAIAPTQFPWQPIGDPSIRRFINELVLEEESDESFEKGQFTSHFELYHSAMTEVGADITLSTQFVDTACSQGVEYALENLKIPEPSRQFTAQTFKFIFADKPHESAAALSLGREHVIPSMFRSILKKGGVKESDAPLFHHYLNRHVHLDEDFHASNVIKAS